MEGKYYEIESSKPFSESLIWHLNRQYYQKSGLGAWVKGEVPHYLTSNARVGKTYAELIFAFLQDVSRSEIVYILEMGAGHGRLAFHILMHLDQLIEASGAEVPPYCYILSDIVEANLDFFDKHPQFQPYLNDGKIDIAYFDAIKSHTIQLRRSGETLTTHSFQQPLLAIGNYFFDSLPNDLFYLENGKIFNCEVALHSKTDPDNSTQPRLLENLELKYSYTPAKEGFYQSQVMTEMLRNYQQTLKKTHLLFPQKGLNCIDNLLNLTGHKLMLLVMDKGFHEIEKLENVPEPIMITHGSISFDVNFHALQMYCQKMGGKAMLPAFSNFHLDMGCLMMTEDVENYQETEISWQKWVNDYGPDDFNTHKKFVFKHIGLMSLVDLISFLRLGYYDSTIFLRVLPQIKKVITRITIHERVRLAETLHKVWETYFFIGEAEDLAFEMAGIFYELGFFREAIRYFGYSEGNFGPSPDMYYNTALCYYQLREDDEFVRLVAKGRAAFPEFENFAHLDKLDLNAE